MAMNILQQSYDGYRIITRLANCDSAQGECHLPGHPSSVPYDVVYYNYILRKSPALMYGFIEQDDNQWKFCYRYLTPSSTEPTRNPTPVYPKTMDSVRCLGRRMQHSAQHAVCTGGGSGMLWTSTQHYIMCAHILNLFAFWLAVRYT